MNFEKYTNTARYPRKQDFTTYYHYIGGECIGQSNDRSPLLSGAVIEKVVDEEAYKEAQDAYYKAESDVKQQFFDELAEELDITNHPKKDKFLYLCWQEGHSGGFSEVYNVACTWVELLED